jgi:hypothetical protein
MARQSPLPLATWPRSVVSKSRVTGREPAHRLPIFFSLSRLRGRAGVGVSDRNRPLKFSPTRCFAPTSPASGRGEVKPTLPRQMW